MWMLLLMPVGCVDGVQLLALLSTDDDSDFDADGASFFLPRRVKKRPNLLLIMLEEESD